LVCKEVLPFHNSLDERAAPALLYIEP